MFPSPKNTQSILLVLWLSSRTSPLTLTPQFIHTMPGEEQLILLRLPADVPPPHDSHPYMWPYMASNRLTTSNSSWHLVVLTCLKCSPISTNDTTSQNLCNFSSNFSSSFPTYVLTSDRFPMCPHMLIYLNTCVPFVAAQQFSVKLLVAFWSFDRIHQLLGFYEVIVIVSLQVVRWGDVARHWGRFPVDAVRPVLLQVCICWGYRHKDREDQVVRILNFAPTKSSGCLYYSCNELCSLWGALATPPILIVHDVL